MLHTVQCPHCGGAAYEELRWLEAADLAATEAIDAETRHQADVLFVSGACAHMTLMSWDAMRTFASGWVCGIDPPLCEHGDAVMLPEALFGRARCVEGHDVVFGPAATGVNRSH